jgi:MFS superfamily sulfate permease-like transporter
MGLLMVVFGLWRKTPIPVQPMKAIGATAIAAPGAITAGAIWSAGLITAAVWFLLALTGAVSWLNRVMPRDVIKGIILGLGISFMLEGIRMMASLWWLALIGAIIAFGLMASRRFPAMLALLALGIGLSFWQDPGLAGKLAVQPAGFVPPDLPFGRIGWDDFMVGALVLALPQVPLTLGNAVLSTTAENNRLFPEKPVTVKSIALDHGFMNVVAFVLGGIPVCHGAGGLAGHVRFGARTGGALVILGIILLVIGLAFSRSVGLIFSLIPAAILGVILLMAGLELAAPVFKGDTEKGSAYVIMLTAGLAVFNMGIAFAAGLALHFAIRKALVKP